MKVSHIIFVLIAMSFCSIWANDGCTALENRLSAGHRILVSDCWGGGHRTIFEFNGRKAWIVEPEKVAEGSPWVWTMQWMGAYLNRTGAPDLVRQGWYHVHLEAFDTRADDKGLKELAAFQEFLVNELGFAKKTNLIGMSWGGFYSVRYASVYPEKVSRVYLDAPLLNVYTLPQNWAKDPVARIGSWALNRPQDEMTDPRMAVNRAVELARARIPVLLLYGKDDLVVNTKLNCEPFLEAFRAAGGSAVVIARDAWGHHPHGLEESEVGRIVDFFKADGHPEDRLSFGPLSPSARPVARQELWPEGRMPNVQTNQVAARWDDVRKPGFNRAANRNPFIEWYAPNESNKTDICVMTISGGGFQMTCDAARLQPVIDRFVRAGITVADVTYRTPRPEGLLIHQSAWEDLQRAVRVVKSEALKRGFSPKKVGATGISAGAKAVLLVATRSQTRAYAPVDAIDEISADLAFAIPQAPAYVLEDGATGRNTGRGIGAGIVPELTFDDKVCSMCFLQGATDVHSPLGSVRLYQRLREKRIAAELHLFADRWHGFHGDATIGDNGTAWDHWCDRMFAFIGHIYPDFPASRYVWSLSPQSNADNGRLEAALPGPIYLSGTENPSLQARLVDDWEREWIKGEQADLHLESVPMTPMERSSRIREYLNHCGL